MASAWGASWSAAWGNSWGGNNAEPTLPLPPTESAVSGGGGAGGIPRRYKKRDAELIALMPVIISLLRN